MRAGAKSEARPACPAKANPCRCSQVKPGQAGPTSELRDLYNVSEMDGCSEEMEFIVAELRKRADAGDAQARL